MKSNHTNTVRIIPVGPYAGYLTHKRGLDTIVFVHGLRGHYQDTWGQFPTLIESDPDLPEVDILLWGYKTGAIKPFVHDTNAIGRQFVSALSANISEGNGLHLIGHSMGGLIILKGLVGEMVGQRAQKHPVRSIRFVSLFASPVSGSTAAGIVKNTFGKLWVIGWVINKQIRSLARGDDCDSLLTEVEHRIYSPDNEDSSARRIPLRMVMATRDGAVTKTDRDNTRARYRRLPPLEFDHDHSSIKLPESHIDQRYRALANDIQTGLAERFRQLCVEALQSDPAKKANAVLEIQQRYEQVLRSRFIAAGGKPRHNRPLYQRYLRFILRDCIHQARPPFDAANRAIISLRSRGYLPDDN